MRSLYRVRFAPMSSSVAPNAIESSQDAYSRARRKSRMGCQMCKMRRVKCDETFPVCFRCQRNGIICKPAVHPLQHCNGVSWLDTYTFASPLNTISNVNKKALRWWLDRTSHIFVFEPDDNPLSFPIFSHLLASQALVHALQSLSVAHQEFFDQASIPGCLEERSRAMVLVQKELQNGGVPLTTSFLSVFFLGVASSWIYQHMQNDFGKEHLKGARAIIDVMLQRQSPMEDHEVKLMIGYYLYWDMQCAFLFPSNEIKPLDTSDMATCAETFKIVSHPLGGSSINLFYRLGVLGRYCRKVIDTSEHDYAYEEFLESSLLDWQPITENAHLQAFGRAYQQHGLLLLYRTCGRPHKIFDSDEEAVIFQLETEQLIKTSARQTVQELLDIPLSSTYANFQGLPILTAASELGPEDVALRAAVTQRLKASYSWIRVNVSLWAVTLLEELWAMRDSGILITPLELMLGRDWMLTMV